MPFAGRYRIYFLLVLLHSIPVAQAADLAVAPDSDNHFEIYGQVNKGVLVYDDGGTTNAFFLVGNYNSSTRAGVRFRREVEPGQAIGFNVEAEWEPYSTGYVNQLNKGDVDWDTALLRKAEVYLDTGAGRVWFGQGSMASDGTAEVDLSGTTVVGYASAGDSASGQFYRRDDGTLSGVTVGDTFTDLDGTGRRLRVRYDSPSINGFVLGSSVGQQVVPFRSGGIGWDVALKYNGVLGDYEVAAAVAYSDPGSRTSKGIVGGSASTLHVPSGWSLTVSGGHETLVNRDLLFVYAKLGHQADYLDIGSTAYSIDIYYGENITTRQSETGSLGGQLVQRVDAWRSEFYLGVRSYDFDDEVADYRRGLSMLTGARVKF